MKDKNTKKGDINDSLKRLNQIVSWFESEKELDIEKGLELVKEGAEIIKNSKQRLKEIENEFKQIKTG